MGTRTGQYAPGGLHHVGGRDPNRGKHPVEHRFETDGRGNILPLQKPGHGQVKDAGAAGGEQDIASSLGLEPPVQLRRLRQDFAQPFRQGRLEGRQVDQAKTARRRKPAVHAHAPAARQRRRLPGHRDQLQLGLDRGVSSQGVVGLEELLKEGMGVEHHPHAGPIRPVERDHGDVVHGKDAPMIISPPSLHKTRLVGQGGPAIMARGQPADARRDHGRPRCAGHA
jgi:hypothetical protein